MKKDTINICIASTYNQYLKYAASFLESLYKNLNPKYNYHLFFLSNEIISRETKNKLFYKKIEQFEVTFIQIDEEREFWKYDNLRNRTNIILYRWLISDYIDEDKILFMDHDTIIRWDISELYFTNLWDNIIWASKDCLLWDTDILKKYNIKKYFNAWVQLINLEKRRENNIKNKALDFLNKNFKKCKIHDQDTLNIILKDKWLPISPKWNWINISTFTHKWTQYTKEEFYDLRHPIITHYAWNSNRPWWWLICVHPQWNLYYKYIFKTKFWDITDILKFPLRILTSNFLCRSIYKILRLLFN